MEVQFQEVKEFYDSVLKELRARIEKLEEEVAELKSGGSQ